MARSIDLGWHGSLAEHAAVFNPQQQQQVEDWEEVNQQKSCLRPQEQVEDMEEVNNGQEGQCRQ